MKVYIEIDERVEDIEIEVKCNEVSQDVLNLVEYLKGFEVNKVVNQYIGEDEYKKYILKYEDTIRFYSQNKKTYSKIISGEIYQVRKTLSEVYENVDKKKFVKISSSEIVNLEYVSHLETYFNGTLKLTFKNGDSTYVSRSCVKLLKKTLGL